MSTISLRLPNSLHDMLRTLAKREKVSINQVADIQADEQATMLETRMVYHGDG